jgi:hypothetical protein
MIKDFVTSKERVTHPIDALLGIIKRDAEIITTVITLYIAVLIYFI